VPGLQARLVGRLAGGLGLFPLTEVVVDAAEQQSEPPGCHQQLPVLSQREPPAEQPRDVAQPLAAPASCSRPPGFTICGIFMRPPCC
jgi:hypothetical protein